MPRPLSRLLTRALLALSLALLLAGCGDTANTSIPPTEPIPFDEALARVKAHLPAADFVTNDFLPDPTTLDQPAPFAPLDEPIQLKVAMPWVFNDEEAAWYVAIENGYFAEAGLDVELIPGGPGIDALSLLVGGRADIAVPAAGLMISRLRSSPTAADVVAIGAKMRHSAYVWMALDETIDRGTRSTRSIGPEDLIGKTVGVQVGYEFVYEYLVRKWQLPEGALKLRKVGYEPGPLLNGSVDFYAAWITNQPRVLEAGGYHNWMALDFGKLGLDEAMDVSVVRRKMAEEQPDVARRYCWALAKGVDFVLKEPRAAAEITHVYAADADLSIEQIMRRFELEKPLVLGDQSLPPLHMNPEAWDHSAAVLLQFGQISLPSLSE